MVGDILKNCRSVHSAYLNTVDSRQELSVLISPFNRDTHLEVLNFEDDFSKYIRDCDLLIMEHSEELENVLEQQGARAVFPIN